LIKTVFAKYFELFFWISALVCLALADPTDQTHFSLCPFRLLGITWCPGCGMGHSISFLFHGELKRSFHAHWLGVPALLGILYRIYVLARMRIFPLVVGE
jgi:hypothetical protein